MSKVEDRCSGKAELYRVLGNGNPESAEKGIYFKKSSVFEN